VNITRGKATPPLRLVVYGPSGVGKSSFACGVSHPDTEAAEGVLALDYEGGLDAIGPARVEGPRSWDGSLTLLREACSGPGDHTTVVVDTIDALANLAAAKICEKGVKGKTVTSLAEFGYGDGFEILATYWRELLFLLESARSAGRTVILVAHVRREKVDDPQVGAYSKWVAALADGKDKNCWSATHRWADDVLFANYETAVAERRAMHTGQRWLYTIAGTGYDAKNRGQLPPQLPLTWSAYTAARGITSRSADAVVESILSMTDADTRPRVDLILSTIKNDIRKLLKLETQLKEKVKAS
jgi:hypothetical protein